MLSAGEPGEVTAHTARTYETFCVQPSIRRLDSRSCEADYNQTISRLLVSTCVSDSVLALYRVQIVIVSYV